MADEKISLSIVEGSAPFRLALSLVHARERINIAVKDVRKIEAHADITFCSDTGMSQTYQAPHVLLEFAPNVGARIHHLTSQIVDEELAIMVADEIIARPIMREPHGLRQTMRISVNDMEEAQKLADKLRQGWIKPALRIV